MSTLTYSKTTITTENKLVISIDTSPFNPRYDDHLGIFITKSLSYKVPSDNNDLHDILISTEANSNTLDEHIESFKKEAGIFLGSPIVYIKLIYRYLAMDIHYTLNEVQNLVGFVIVTQANVDKVNIKAENIQKQIEIEIKEYSKYANSKVYKFVLYNDDGEVINSCSGFYKLTDIKKHLPEEYQDIDLINFLKK